MEWCQVVGPGDPSAAENAPETETFDEFIARNPRLLRGDLYGGPDESPPGDRGADL
jgi:hypothetical protein